jgi:hypothetical protein
VSGTELVTNAAADPLRIVLVAPPYFDISPKGYGGTEAVVADLADALVKRGLPNAATLLTKPQLGRLIGRSALGKFNKDTVFRRRCGHSTHPPVGLALLGQRRAVGRTSSNTSSNRPCRSSRPNATHRSSRHTQPTWFGHAETALVNQRHPGWSTGPAAGPRRGCPTAARRC